MAGCKSWTSSMNIVCGLFGKEKWFFIFLWKSIYITFQVINIIIKTEFYSKSLSKANLLFAVFTYYHPSYCNHPVYNCLIFTAINFTNG